MVERRRLWRRFGSPNGLCVRFGKVLGGERFPIAPLCSAKLLGRDRDAPFGDWHRRPLRLDIDVAVGRCSERSDEVHAGPVALEAAKFLRRDDHHFLAAAYGYVLRTFAAGAAHQLGKRALAF